MGSYRLNVVQCPICKDALLMTPGGIITCLKQCRTSQKEIHDSLTQDEYNDLYNARIKRVPQQLKAMREAAKAYHSACDELETES